MLRENVHWTGYKPHDYFLEMLYQADLFLSPSITASNGDTEGGAPVAIIEAGASGLPVISTRHADIPEVVLDGHTGLLSPERNVHGLVAAICCLARSRDQTQNGPPGSTTCRTELRCRATRGGTRPHLRGIRTFGQDRIMLDGICRVPIKKRKSP